MTTIRSVLSRMLEDPEYVVLSRSILKSTDPNSIEMRISQLCRETLGSGAECCLTAELSVGATFGLRLADGRDVFVKIHRPGSPYSSTGDLGDYLKATSYIQSELARSGFPCPPPVHDPVRFGDGYATIDQFMAPGKQVDAHNPKIREGIAITLADLILRLEPYKSLPGLARGLTPGLEQIYPTPHNALFDFAATKEGAEWIDDIACRSLTTMHRISGRTVLGHADWSTKHFRFVGTQVAMIYDWDSLRLDDELRLVGNAAAHFPATWDMDVKKTPSQDEAWAFVAEYEKARGKSFNQDELRKISASITYSLAYTARCEHALDPEGRDFDTGFRKVLYDMSGDSYLDVLSRFLEG